MNIVSPRGDAQWRAYYEFRWRQLRAPWRQAKGSEKDQFEQNAYHVMAKNDLGEITGVGRIHQVAPGEWQIRYMAVDVKFRNAGVGSRILKTLEDYARTQGAGHIVLNSRVSALNFYEKHGYQVVADAPTLFGEIAHKNMRKTLRIFPP